jgi:hypothetical protein
MIRHLSKTPSKQYPAGVRLVHNFYPGPADDPGRNRPLGAEGFRAWITDEPNDNERCCYCGWLDGREHYGTVGYVDAEAHRRWRGERQAAGYAKGSPA